MLLGPPLWNLFGQALNKLNKGINLSMAEVQCGHRRRIPCDHLGGGILYGLLQLLMIYRYRLACSKLLLAAKEPYHRGSQFPALAVDLVAVETPLIRE